MTQSKRIFLACTIFAILSAVACGESFPSLSPAAPSPTNPSSGLSGATINGSVISSSSLDRKSVV